MSKRSLKCGRKLYPLIGGDIVMDNGSCYQLTTRATKQAGAPTMGKDEFERFLGLNGVTEVIDHNYHDSVKLWRYDEA